VIILISDYIYTPTGYLEGKAIAFDKVIESIGEPDELVAKFPDAKIVRAKPHTILYPGLINSHVHLEFSSNKTHLKYGDFMPWLHSVIKNRDEIAQESDNACMHSACNEMLRSGITSFGAISSFGGDLEVCREVPQRVTFYNELIGSDAQTADMLYGDFLQRVAMSEEECERDRITPAIAIHSPYSVHPILVQKGVSLAKQKGYPLSAHLLESKAEKDWLDNNSGEFAKFFDEYFGAKQAVNTADGFINQFDTYPTQFVHCTQTSKAQREYLVSKNHSIAHCPRSNRLLGCDRLPIEELNDSVMTLATDGMSSNYTLNIWDELRAALHLHHKGPLSILADRLMRSVTLDAAKAMGSNAGRLEPGAPADIISVTLPDRVENIEDLSLMAILHTKDVQSIYIDAEPIKI